MNVCRARALIALLSMPMGLHGLAQAAVCDIDADGDVDRLDIKSVVTARNEPARGSGDLRDADGDGTITVLDARICIRQCSQPGCPVVGAPAARPSGDAGRAAANEVGKTGTVTSDRTKTDPRSGTMLRSNQWKVARGDTLYAIGRAIYPGDAGRQARLRQDIVTLNPDVFAGGADNMAIGTVLKLPDYVVPQTAPTRPAIPPAVTTQVSPPTRAAEPAKAEPLPESPPESASPAAAIVSETGTPPAARADPVRVESNALVSLGYSYGGEKLDYEDTTYGPGGIGIHLRLGFEQMFQHFGGYRLSLGYQYSSAGDGGGSISYDDNYLSLAYQYRSDPLVYGIGVVHSRGARLEDDSRVDYDPADGVVLYLENAGKTNLAGWGLSYTAMEIDEKGSGESFDVSRVELYYNWKF